MKIKNKKQIDVLKEIKKSSKYELYSKGADVRIRLAVEVYNAREILSLSQSELAKKLSTTQRIISNIEDAEINIGIELLGRIVEVLKFDSCILSKVFKCDMGPYPYSLEAASSADNRSSIVFNKGQVLLEK
jgi:ribosome-binding protein aMBF1 (putative translation factor)